MKTDSQLHKDILAELRWESQLHAEKIGVEVNGGAVTLTGHVSIYAQRLGAEHAALRVSGVRSLAVHIEVKRRNIVKRSAPERASDAQGVLLWTTF